jgi:hypothetical protein
MNEQEIYESVLFGQISSSVSACGKLMICFEDLCREMKIPHPIMASQKLKEDLERHRSFVEMEAQGYLDYLESVGIIVNPDYCPVIDRICTYKFDENRLDRCHHWKEGAICCYDYKFQCGDWEF